MLDKNILDLLALLRLAVSGGDKTALSENLDWDYLAAASRRQGVGALVLDAVDKLPAELRPAKPLLLQWIGHTAMMEQMYAQHKEQIASLAAFYKEHGISVLLLKGYGCSLCYPKPEHRPTGDIDIYLFGKQEETDALVEKELGISVHREYHKHSTFRYEGAEVENHAKFIDDVSHKSNIRFEETLMTTLEREACGESPVDNVLLTPPTFNALFLLRHTGEHFASNEITLRQVLDVGLFFTHHHGEVDWSFVFNVYRSERMLNFFNGIATICVEYLGMDATCFASADGAFSYKHDVELADRILADIFLEKERLQMSMVGIDTLPKKLKYGIEKTLRWWNNRWKYQLVYNENLCQSFWWLARNRMK